MQNSKTKPVTANMNTVSITNDLRPYLASLQSYLDRKEGSINVRTQYANGSGENRKLKTKPENHTFPISGNDNANDIRLGEMSQNEQCLDKANC
jgi:hypothetical protein